MLESRQVLAGSTRGPVAGARFIGRTDAAAPVRVTVVLKRKNPVDAAHLRDYTALLPHQRPIVDHDDGITAVQTIASAHGLSVVHVDKKRRVLELSGTATNMELAFGTELDDYRVRIGNSAGGAARPRLINLAPTGRCRTMLGAVTSTCERSRSALSV
jgi:hypothetical protein